MAEQQRKLKIEKANQLYSNKWKVDVPSYVNKESKYTGCFSKGFKHVSSDPNYPVNIVEQKPYRYFLRSIRDQNYEKIKKSQAKFSPTLVDPFCICDLELNGKYMSNYPSREPPSVSSAEGAAEIVEVYEMALLRDVPYYKWNTSEEVKKAIDNLNLLSDFRGPKQDGKVTLQTLFRSDYQGVLEGPYVSQMLYQGFNMGSAWQDQKYRCTAGKNYLTTIPEYLDAWNGKMSSKPDQYEYVRHLCNLRDCGIYIHKEQPWQVGLTAHCVLQTLKVPLSVEVDNRKNTFISLGLIDIINLLTRAYKLAMDVTWLTKYIKQKLRPEEFAYQIHLAKTGHETVSIHKDALDAPVLKQVFEKQGNYLLSQGYPEGCPCHPAFPSGHATYGGASITILKAFYNTNFIIPQSYTVNEQGDLLIPIADKLTVGGELNKLACNCGTFRNIAGIHYRSDCDGNLIGEKVALDLLREFVDRYQGKITFTVPLFDGSIVKITNEKEPCDCECHH